jgi:hypothetical protein
MKHAAAQPQTHIGGPSFAKHYRTWAIVTGTLLLLLFIVAFGVYDRALDEWYWLTFAAPALQGELGFRTGSVPVKNYDGQLSQLFGITSVHAGGRFDRAGFRAGDVPSEWFMHGGASSGFYSRLQRSRCLGPTEFKVVAATDLSSSGRSHERTLRIQVPCR